MPFKNLRLHKTLESSTHNLSKDFFIPVLSESINYDRGVGYFTSGWLTSVSDGIIPLVERGGKIRLITSPNLQPRDYDAMLLGDKARQDEVIFNALSRDIAQLSEDLKGNVRVAMSWLIADQIMDIKIAIPRNKLSGGDFHVKFGIFSDLEKEQIAFTGSYNDTEHANLNYEEIAIFRSSEIGESGLVKQKQSLFDRLWNDQDPNIRILNIPQVILNTLINMRNDAQRPYKVNNLGDKEIRPQFKPRPYQEEAIEKWFNANCHGAFEMATGSGKTKTSLYAAARLREKFPQLLLVVAVPTTTLVDQWTGELQDFGYKTIQCSSMNTRWKNDVIDELVKLNFDSKRAVALVCTHEALKSESLNEKLGTLDKARAKVLLIGDECHHLGSEKTRRSELFKYDFTLGLSATPERYFDQEGSAFVQKFLGEVVFKYPLRKAINEGFLCPYEYHIHDVYLTDDEMNDYIETSNKISKLMARVGASENLGELFGNTKLLQLLNQRAMILKTASGKIPALNKAITGCGYKIDHAVIFCAPDTDELDVVSALLRDINVISHRFTSIEKDRKILDDFDKGIYQILTAMNIFNEGIDIPSAKEAFILSSSSNPTEFVQRRGRILRKNPQYPKERATIHDFVVLPTLGERSTSGVFEKKILQKEIERCYLFAEDALNGISVMEKLNKLMSEYLYLPTHKERK